jgi:hypothetical protein
MPGRCAKLQDVTIPDEDLKPGSLEQTTGQQTVRGQHYYQTE